MPSDDNPLRHGGSPQGRLPCLSDCRWTRWLAVAAIFLAHACAAQQVITVGQAAPGPLWLAVDAAGDVVFDLPFSLTPVPADVRVMHAVGGKIPDIDPSVTSLGGTFSFPGGLAVNSATLDVFVADYGNDAVKEIVFADHSIRTVGGFDRPFSVALDAHANLYAIDGSGTAIKQIVAVNGVIPDKPTIRTLAVAGSKGFVGPAMDLTLDRHGNLFFVESPVAGSLSAVKELAAVNGSIPDNANAVTVATGFSRPSSVAAGTSGDLFVADNGLGAVIELLAVDGSLPPQPQRRIVGTGFDGPNGIALDTLGNVYVAEVNTYTIKEILLSDVIFRDGLELPPPTFPIPPT